MGIVKIGIAPRGGLGDVLMTTPAIKSIKSNNLSKELWVYCITEVHYELLKNNQYVDVLVRPEEQEKMKEEFLDSEIRFYNIGDLFPGLNEVKKKGSNILCDFFRTPYLGDNLEIYLTNEEERFGKTIMDKFRFPVTINPTSFCSKNEEWDISNWTKIISQFPQIDFIQIGKSDEQKISGAIDYRGVYNLRECIAILKNSKIYLGVDSFFGHVASAFDIKGIILFGDSSPFVYGHDNNINIYKALPCSPCFELLGGSSCPYNIACMKEISIEMVSNEIREILLNCSK